MQAAAVTSSHRVSGNWMRAPQTIRVMHALLDNGAQARFVGGCVRDTLLAHPVRDIDIAVDVEPEESVRILESAGLKVIPTGIDHGTITAVCDDTAFEITSLRRDVATDGRRATIAYTKDWAEDAARRDFTMNALYADLDGTLHDVLGSGLADASARRVRFIGSAQDRIQEDYLRILRLFRFHAWYGDGEMEPMAVVAAAGLAGGIAKLSRERVGQEMLKLLAARQPAQAVQTMAQCGVLAHALPMARADAPLEALQIVEQRVGASPDSIRRLALLIWKNSPDETARSLRLSNEQFKALKQRRATDFTLESSASARRLGYERGELAGRDVMLLNAAQTTDTIDLKKFRQVTEGADFELPLTAQDIMAFGVPAGPAVGKGLSEAEAVWISSDFTLDKSSLLDHVKARLNG